MKPRTGLLLMIVGMVAVFAFLVIRADELGVKRVSKTEVSESISNVPGKAEVLIKVHLREGNPEHEADHFIGPYRGVNGVRQVTLLIQESVLKVVYDPTMITEQQIRELL